VQFGSIPGRLAISSLAAGIVWLSAAGVGTAQQTLLQFDTSSLTGTSGSASATTTATGVATGSVLLRGTGLTAGSITGGLNSSQWASGTASLAAAMANGKFYTFTIAPEANYSLSFSTVTGTTQRSAAGPNQSQWAYGIDGFAGLGDVFETGTSATSSSRNLSDTNVTAATEFRVASWFTTGTGAGGGTLRIITPTLSGSATLRSATTLTWDGGRGSGNWDAYDGYAANQSNWNLNNIPLSSGDSLTFAGSTQTTTNNTMAGLSIDSILFASGAASFTNTGNALTLTGSITNSSSNLQTISHALTLAGGGRTIDTASGGITIGGALSGEGGLTKQGSHQLTLTAGNAYSGVTTISSGTLRIGAGGTSGSITGDITNNASLVFDRSDAIAYSGAISGNGTLTKAGANSLTLSGNSSGYTGSTTVSAGRLVATGTLGGSVTVSSGATLAGAGAVGAVTIGSGGILSPGTSPGTLTVESLTWQGGGFYDWELYDATAAAGTGYDTISSSGALTINATSGSPFTIRLLTLSGTNPDTPGNALNFNTAVSSTFTLGSFGSIAGFSADKFSFDRTGFANTAGGSFSLITTGATDNILSLVYTAPVITAYDYTGGTGDWSMAGNWLNAAGPTGSGTAAIIVSGTAGGTSTNDLAAGDFSTAKGFTFAVGAGSYTVAGNALTIGIEGLGILNESSNAQTMALDLTLANPLTIDAASGSLTISGAIATAGNALMVDGAQNVSLAAVSGTGSLVKLGLGQTTLTGTVGAANVTVSGGTLLLGGANRLADSAGVTVNGGTLDVQGHADTVGSLTLTSGSVAGSGGTLTATTYTLSGGGVGANLGGGTLTVTGNATLAGTAGVASVNLDGGALALGTGGRFTAAPVVTGSGGAALTLGGNEAIGSLAGAVNIALGTGTLTIGSADTSTTYSGTISGAGGLVKVGTGSLTLSGTTTATGGWTISGGGLIGTTASLVGNIANSGTVTFSQDSDGTYAGTLSGAGGLAKSGTGAVTLSGNNSGFSGATTLSAGRLVVGNVSALGSGGITLSGGTLTADATSRTLANAVTITANVGLAAASSGTLTLSAAVNLGGGTRTLTVESGATAVLGGGYGTGGVTKAGTGTLVLGSSGTLTGLALSSGTLRIADGAAVTTTTSQLSSSASTLLEISGTLRSTLAGTAWAAPAGNVTVGAAGVVIQQGNSAVTNFLFDNKVTWSQGSTFVFRDYTGGPAVSNRNYAMNVVFDSSGSPVNVGSITGSGTWTIQGDLAIGENVNFTFGSFTGALDYQKNVIVGGTLGTTANAARSFTINSGRELRLENAGALNIAAGQTVTISGSVRSTASAAQIARISGGTLSLGGGTRTFDIAAGTGDALLEIGSVIADGPAAGGLTKTGAGTLRLTSINTFTGPTSIEAGRLEFGPDAALASALIIVKSQAFLDARSLAEETLELNDGQTLQSGGTVEGNLVVGTGAVLAPGASTGTSVTTGTTTFGPGGGFQFEINDALGAAGSTTNGWDLLITGALEITATVDNPFEIDIVSMTTGVSQERGDVSNFTGGSPYEWRFVTASEEIQNFNASVFLINTTNFLPADWFGPGRGFSVGLGNYGGGINNALVIYYTPEPTTWMLAVMGLASGGWLTRRRTARHQTATLEHGVGGRTVRGS